MSVDSGATLSGFGSVAGSIVDNGTMTATGGKLILSGPLSGTGILTAAAGAVLDLTAGGSLGEDISGAGTLERDSFRLTHILGDGRSWHIPPW